MIEDEVIREVWQVRDEIAARFNYDVRAIGAYYLKLQEESGIPTVSLPPRKPVVMPKLREQNGNGGKLTPQIVQANGTASRSLELDEAPTEIEEYAQ